MMGFSRRLKRSIYRVRRGTSAGDQFRFTLRSLLWGLRLLIRRPVTFRIGGHGGRMRVPAQLGAGAAAPFILRERYEPEVGFLEKALRPGDVFVDGGANLGIYTVLASNLVGPSGKVLSFEPGAVTFERLQQSIDANPVQNVHAHMAALSDKVGEAPLYHSQDHFVSYSLATDETAADSEMVQTLTIDEALAQDGLERLDFLKLDVEGAEELALRGAQKSIESWHPLVMFESEVVPGAPGDEGHEPDGAWRFLEERGYTLGIVGADGRLAPAEQPRLGNNIAVPPDRAQLFEPV
jgi:FkbM family methyltransferase